MKTYPEKIAEKIRDAVLLEAKKCEVEPNLTDIFGSIGNKDIRLAVMRPLRYLGLNKDLGSTEYEEMQRVCSIWFEVSKFFPSIGDNLELEDEAIRERIDLDEKMYIRLDFLDKNNKIKSISMLDCVHFRTMEKIYGTINEFFHQVHKALEKLPFILEDKNKDD